MTWCRGLSGTVLVLGCASTETPPAVIIAAAPPARATPRAAAPVTPAPATSEVDEPARIDSPLWRPVSSAEPSPSPPSSSRGQAPFEATDSLMDGDLTLAEQVCAPQPASQRRECIDAFLVQRMAEIGKGMDRSLRGLELLERAGEKLCPGTPDSERHSACVLAEMERMVTQLAPACARKSGQAQHECIIDEVFRQLGP